MSLTIQEIAVPTFVAGLKSLKGFLDKAAAHAEEKKIEPRALLDARLYPNMFAFTRQIQIATDLVRRGLDRLVGKEPASVEDKETTFAELVARVEATLEHVNGADRAAIDAAETSQITIDMGQKLEFTGRSYVTTFVIPNFMFHVVTAYNILRHNGIELGKRDYLEPFVRSGAA